MLIHRCLWIHEVVVLRKKLGFLYVSWKAVRRAVIVFIWPHPIWLKRVSRNWTGSDLPTGFIHQLTISKGNGESHYLELFWVNFFLWLEARFLVFPVITYSSCLLRRFGLGKGKFSICPQNSKVLFWLKVCSLCLVVSIFLKSWVRVFRCISAKAF